MVLSADFKVEVLEIVKEITELNNITKPNIEFLKKMYEPENISEFAFGVIIGVMEGLTMSLFHIKHKRLMTSEEVNELSQFIADNSSILRKYIEDQDLK